MSDLRCADCGIAIERRHRVGRPPKRCDGCNEERARAYWRRLFHEGRISGRKPAAERECERCGSKFAPVGGSARCRGCRFVRDCPACGTAFAGTRRYCSSSCAYKRKRALTPGQVLLARARYIAGEPIRGLAREWGVAHMTVYRAARGETYRDVTEAA